MKHLLLLISTFFVCMAPDPVWAGAATGHALLPSASTSLVKAPYSACEGVKLRATGNSKHTSPGKHCADSEEQALPRTGYTVFELDQPTQALAFLTKVGRRASRRLDDNLKALKELRSCYNERWDEKKPLDCLATRAAVSEKLQRILPAARQTLALSEAQGPAAQGEHAGVVTDLLIPKPEEAVSTSLKPKSGDLFRPSEIAPLTADELKLARLTWATDLANAKPEPSTDFIVRYQQVNRAYKARYLALVQELPIVAFLKNPIGLVSPDEIRGAFDKLIKNASDSKDEIDRTLKKGETRFKNGRAALLRDDQERIKDMTDFISLGASVEEQLREDPSDCAIATALFKQNGYANEREMALWAAAGVVTTFASGGLGAGALATVGRMTVSAAGMARFAAGPALASALTAREVVDANQADRQAYSQSGLSETEGGIRSIADAVKAREHAGTAVALLPLAWIPAATLGRLEKLERTVSPQQLERVRKEFEPVLKAESNADNRKAFELLIAEAEKKGVPPAQIKSELEAVRKTCTKSSVK